MTLKLTALVRSSLIASALMVQTPSGKTEATQQVCEFVSANPPDFNPFQFIPKATDFTRLNRFPKVAFEVNEDGSVSKVNILKGTGSPKVDLGLIKSIQAWKYKPQSGCKMEASMTVMIEIGAK